MSVRPPHRTRRARASPDARRVGRNLLLAALLAAAGSGCSATPAPATSRATDARPGPALSLRPCRLPGLAHELQCGELRRPLDRADPGSPALHLRVAVLPASARRKRADPVVFLAGGPGQSAVELAPQVLPLLQRLNGRRDLVFLEQRGTGLSAPLRCPPPEGPPPPLSERLDPSAALPALRTCLADWRRLPHGDLRHYATPDATADLEALRQALGAPQFNLVGVSYGSRAALDYLRRHPGQVRRMVLDGVAPPDLGLPFSQAADGQAALDAALRACETDPACRDRHPALQAQTAALLATPPAATSVRDPLSGQARPWAPTPETLRTVLRATLYSPLAAAGLPTALAAAAQGRYEPLLGLAALHSAALGSGRRGGVAEGPHFAVLCSEDFPRGPAAQAAEPYRSICPDWPRATLPVDFDTLPPSPAPVLLLSGGADPVTPPRHAERTAAALGPRARHLVAPHHGHGLLGTGCTRGLLGAFIDAADTPAAQAAAVDPVADCLAGLPRMPVHLPPASPP